jgi:hypothetical protein
MAATTSGSIRWNLGSVKAMGNPMKSGSAADGSGSIRDSFPICRHLGAPVGVSPEGSHV